MNFIRTWLQFFLPFLFYNGFAKHDHITFDEKKYFILEHDICNFKNVTDEEFEFIKTLPKEKLLDLLQIYRRQIKLINYILSDSA